MQCLDGVLQNIAQHVQPSLFASQKAEVLDQAHSHCILAVVCHKRIRRHGFVNDSGGCELLLRGVQCQKLCIDALQVQVILHRHGAAPQPLGYFFYACGTRALTQQRGGMLQLWHQSVHAL